jgi:hypothetical protein
MTTPDTYDFLVTWAAVTHDFLVGWTPDTYDFLVSWAAVTHDFLVDWAPDTYDFLDACYLHALSWFSGQLLV